MTCACLRCSSEGAGGAICAAATSSSNPSRTPPHAGIMWRGPTELHIQAKSHAVPAAPQTYIKHCPDASSAHGCMQGKRPPNPAAGRERCKSDSLEVGCGPSGRGDQENVEKDALKPRYDEKPN